MKNGDKFSIKGRQDLGVVTLAELDGDTAYVELKNGVEMEFDVMLLMPPTNQIDFDTAITSGWMDEYIGKEMLKELAKFHEVTIMKVMPGSTPWISLSSIAKLNHIAVWIKQHAPIGVSNGKDLYNKMNNGLLSTRTVQECLVIQAADFSDMRQLVRMLFGKSYIPTAKVPA